MRSAKDNFPYMTCGTPDSQSWDTQRDGACAAVPMLEPVPHASAHQLRVLVLEDDSLQSQLLQQTLDSLGLATVIAHSLREARQQLKLQPIDLGVFDLHLPDGSGIELCNEIDNDSKLAGLPVVIVSSNKHSDVVRRTRAVGCSYFISKPYDPNVLIAIVERLIGMAF